MDAQQMACLRMSRPGKRRAEKSRRGDDTEFGTEKLHSENPFQRCSTGKDASSRLGSPCKGAPPHAVAEFGVVWQARSRSMTEMADASEDHGCAQTVCGGNHFFVAHRSAGLNESRRAMLCRFLYSVRKRKERIGSHDSSLQRENRLHRTDLYGVHTAHLSSAHAHQLPAA